MLYGTVLWRWTLLSLLYIMTGLLAGMALHEFVLLAANDIERMISPLNVLLRTAAQHTHGKSSFCCSHSSHSLPISHRKHMSVKLR